MKARGLQTSVRQALAESDSLPLYSMTDWQKVRPIVIRLCAGQCVQCGSSYGLEVDHIQPLAVAGMGTKPFDPAGLQLLCRHCHQDKTTELDQAAGMAQGYSPDRDKRDDRLRELLATQGRTLAQAVGVRVNHTMGNVLTDTQQDHQNKARQFRDHVGF